MVYDLNTFTKRLSKIGIKVEMFGNYPWVYFDTINGKRVTEKFESEHKFTLCYRVKGGVVFTNLTEIFKIIRKYK